MQAKIPFTAVVLAAGQGTRMRSALPKVLHDLCGRPLALWPIAAAYQAGAAALIVVQSPQRPLDGVLPEGALSVVQQQANGTGGAVAAAAGSIDATMPVLVLSGDVPLLDAATIGDLIALHTERAAAATVLGAELADPTGYGRLVRDGEGFLQRIVETKWPGDATVEQLAISEINAGAYVFEPEALLAALPRLGSGNAQQELYLTDVIALLTGEGRRVAALLAGDERVALGVNDRLQLAEARRIARAEIHGAHLAAGVDIVDPESTSIDVGVRIEADARIEPGTILRGSTTVAAGAVVGPQATVIDSQLGERSRVRMSWVEAAQVGDDASVGPFAHLRPGTRLAADAKAGSFVEIKASEIGRGAKVPHLSYIGDAEIGAGSNLGAATITANYDGREKHRTVVGERVRTGVDTTLVAPVKLGDDAYTAAGSVITKDVPAEALAIARSRQGHIEGYAGRRQEEAERAGEGR